MKRRPSTHLGLDADPAAVSRGGLAPSHNGSSERTGTLNIGGSIVPAGGVVFIGATIDCRFRAFDSRSGKQVWEAELPACAHSTPMTFLGKDGRQYVEFALPAAK